MAQVVAPMTTLADEIARAAVDVGRMLPDETGRFDASDALSAWILHRPCHWYVAISYARGYLHATMPLQAPRKPPQQPQAPEGGMMGEFW